MYLPFLLSVHGVQTNVLSHLHWLLQVYLFCYLILNKGHWLPVHLSINSTKKIEIYLTSQNCLPLWWILLQTFNSTQLLTSFEVNSCFAWPEDKLLPKTEGCVHQFNMRAQSTVKPIYTEPTCGQLLCSE